MLRQSDLRTYTSSAGISETAGTIRVTKAAGRKTAFLCHSHLDRELAERVQSFLQSKGWSIYIDWKDAEMPTSPNRETAEKIQAKIKDLDWFLFLATQNSLQSKWCPWELGYADGKKGRTPIAIIPTVDDSGARHGTEYMALYKRIDQNISGSWRLIDTNEEIGTALSSV